VTISTTRGLKVTAAATSGSVRLRLQCPFACPDTINMSMSIIKSWQCSIGSVQYMTSIAGVQHCRHMHPRSPGLAW
jgi:hypothetical protein